MLLERNEIEDKFKWDVESLYKDLEAWEEDYERLESLLEEIEQYQGRLDEDAETLYELFRMRDEASRTVVNLYVYSNLKMDEDTRVSKYQSLKDRAFGGIVEYENKTAFIVPELLNIDRNIIDGFLMEKEELKLYRQYLDEVYRMKDHVLSAREESIMAQVSEISSAPENVFGMLSNADLKFPMVRDEDGKEIQITNGNFVPLLESKNREFRKDVFKSYYEVFEQFKNTFAATLSGEVKARSFNAKIRNYENSLEAALDQNNIPVGVYDNLIKSIHGGLEPMYKYMEIRKRALGVEKHHMYDIYTPIVSDVNTKFTYEEAQDMIIDALSPLGENYIEILKKGFNSRWVDVYENVGKRSGGYSSGTYDSKPFILLNYKDTLDSVFTTAHEMGHSIHSYLSIKKQPYIYSSYSIFVAEVASTVNEVLLINYLINKSKDKKEKAYLLNHFLDGFRTTVYRQTMFAEFEKIINHKVESGGALTAEYLSNEYKKLNELYYGEEVCIDDEIAIEWARIPHFYYNFYVYQYATGYSAAVAIVDKILSGEEGIVEKYIEFLSSGSSDYPINILKKLGIDMENGEAVNRAIKRFTKMVNEMDKLV